jgi:hypothetical protein
MAATAAPTTPELFIEQSIGPVRVDRLNGVLRGIKICGLRSKNGRRYTEAALRKAVRLYEGAKVNIDHLKPGESCPADKRLGHLEEVYWSDTPTKGLYGNLRFPPDHPKAAWLCSVAEHTPNDLGMSHRASAGDVSFDGKGEPIVESISEVESVDLVADPATVGGLFEEVDPTRKPPMKKAVQALLEAAALFPIQKVPLKELVDDSALATALAEEIEVAETTAPVDAAKTAFGSLAAHLMVTGAPAAAFASLVERRAKFLGEEIKPVVEAKPDAKIDDVPKVAGAITAAKLCEQVKYTPTAGQLALLAEETEPKAKAIAEEFARIALSRPEAKPLSGTREQPVTESANPPKAARTPDELAARIA